MLDQGRRGFALRCHLGQLRAGPATAWLQAFQQLIAGDQALPRLQRVVEEFPEAGFQACLRSRAVLGLALQGQVGLSGPATQARPVEHCPDPLEPIPGPRLQFRKAGFPVTAGHRTDGS